MCVVEVPRGNLAQCGAGVWGAHGGAAGPEWESGPWKDRVGSSLQAQTRQKALGTRCCSLPRHPEVVVVESAQPNRDAPQQRVCARQGH